MMRQGKMLPTFATATILVICFSALGCRHAPKPEGSGAVSLGSTGLASSAAPELLDNKMPGWRQGQHYRYRIQMSSRIALGDRALLFDFDLTGAAELVAFAVTPDTASFYVAIEGAKFVSRTPGTQPQFDKLCDELKRLYSFDMKGGLVTRAYMPKDLHPMAAAVFRTISASLQFARTQHHVRSFDANEFDTTGQYVAEYLQLAEPHSWRKIKRRYLSVLPPKDQSVETRGVIPEVVHSEGVIRVSDAGRPTEIRTRDELLLKTSQAPLRSKTEVSIVAEPVGAVASSIPDGIDLRDGSIAVAVDAPFESGLDGVDLDEAKIDGMTFVKVLRQFEKIAQRPKPSKPEKGLASQARQDDLQKQGDEESKLFVALSAIFRRQPDTVNQAIRTIQANSPVRDILVDGLGSADSSFAQHALIQLAKNNGNDDRLRTRALISLSRTEHPTPECVNALISLADNETLGAQALYGIGSYCRHFRDAGRTDVASKLGNLLAARLSVASASEAQLVVVLRAIGTSGYAPALANIQPFLFDRREKLRVETVRALSAMDGPEIDSMLVERLSSNDSKLVRMAAIEAMRARKPSDTLAVSLQKASAIDDPHVRYRAVDLMVRWLEKRPELRQGIELVANNDREQEIRELAKAAL